jgi:hypothetical protein
MAKSFKKYDEENPKIWELFLYFSRQAKQKGFKNYSAKGIFELIRWHTKVEGKHNQFKVNNNYHADYARKLMNFDKSFQGFFRTRKRNNRQKSISLPNKLLIQQQQSSHN